MAAAIPFVFTRYLYVKCEVYYALLAAILAKDQDQSLFWACELYYSGFQDDLFQFLWTVYYDFYSTLNPSFENYLLCTYNNYTTLSKDIAPIANIVINLCIRPCNTDVFILRHTVKQIEIDTGVLNNNNQFDNNKETFTNWLAEQNYECISQFILAECSPNDLRVILEETCNYFVWSGLDLRIPKILKTFDKLCSCSTSQIHSRNILLSRIIQFFTTQSGPPVKPRNIYLTIHKDDLAPFQTSLCPAPDNYKTLRTVYKYNINASSLLGMFAAVRPDNLVHLYHDHWTYWAAGSPYWAAAIQLYGGKLCRQTHSVAFATALQEEEFYQIYGLEPDEQPLKVQRCVIQEIGAAAVQAFYERFKKFNVLATDKDYLDALECISYFD